MAKRKRTKRTNNDLKIVHRSKIVPVQKRMLCTHLRYIHRRKTTKRIEHAAAQNVLCFYLNWVNIFRTSLSFSCPRYTSEIHYTNWQLGDIVVTQVKLFMIIASVLFIELFTLITRVSDRCLMPNEQFCSYTICENKLHSTRWWWYPLRTRPMHFVGF